jgi:hypothetical protein
VAPTELAGVAAPGSSLREGGVRQREEQHDDLRYSDLSAADWHGFCKSRPRACPARSEVYDWKTAREVAGFREKAARRTPHAARSPDKSGTKALCPVPSFRCVLRAARCALPYCVDAWTNCCT